MLLHIGHLFACLIPFLLSIRGCVRPHLYDFIEGIWFVEEIDIPDFTVLFGSSRIAPLFMQYLVPHPIN